jgi:hypothetical protein
MTTTHRRANRWTLTRRLTDRLIPHLLPGRHHIIWEVR